MKKVLKAALWTVLILFFLIVVAVLAHPYWAGPLVRSVANGQVPKYTGTPFMLGVSELNLYKGALHLGELTLYNPPGYSEKRAFSLDSLKVELDAASLFSDTIIFRRIDLDGAFVAIVEHNGVGNFKRIGSNVESASGDSSKAERTERVVTDAEPSAAEAADDVSKKDDASKKKVVIDTITLNNLKVCWMGLTFPVPTIVVRDIGRESGGVTWSIAGEEISTAIMKQVQALSGGLLNFGRYLRKSGEKAVSNSVSEVSAVLHEGVTKLSTAAEKTAEAALSEVRTGSGQTAAVATNAVNLLFKTLREGLKAAETGSSEVLDSTGEAMKQSRDALKDMFKRRKKK